MKIVTVHDVEKATYGDLSSQFYLTEEDIGKNRAEACVAKLSELNEYVQVEALSGELTEEIIAKFKVVVLVNRPEEEIERISELCRKHEVKFMVADIAGLFARVFVDVGSKHTVTDGNGERIRMYAIGNISQGDRTIVEVVDGETHDLDDGDFVQFSMVEGMTELNELKEPVRVGSKNRISFYVDVNSKDFHEYTKNGYVTEVKIPKDVSHKPYKEEVKAPTLVENGDYVHFTRPSTLHTCFLVMNDFRKNHAGALPKPHDEKDAAEFTELAKKKHAELFPDADAVPFDEEIATVFGRICSGNTAPMTSAIGGIVGQEVMKAVTNKLTPLSQWLYLDSTQCLDLKSLPTAKDAEPQNTRYDGQVAVFGRKFQEKLLNLKVFLVGAGAIGCEALKNFALMGIACGPKGLITVTDMDNIELSNLSRQFLFRQKDVQKPKSETAAQSIKKINPNVNVKALTIKVGTETESVFNSGFWKSLDIVANALDNVLSRLYVDSQCVNYGKPLFECGTLGTKGNTQPVIPHLTDNYGATSDPPEKDLPMCTVRNLPFMIEHTIEYARGLFVELFTEQFADAESYLRDSKGYMDRLKANPSNRMIVMNNLFHNLVDERPKDFDDCIRWGKKVFVETFYNQIKQLLFNFPPNAMSEEGLPFWSGKRRQPTPIVFSKDNPMHVAFVTDAAFIRATGFNLPIPSPLDVKHIGEVADSYKLPEFVPRTDVKIEYNDKVNADGEGGEALPSDSSTMDEVEKKIEQERVEEEEEFVTFAKKVPASGSKELAGVKITSIEFEKDDDSNHHIDFITNCANLRAINYDIPVADRSRVKLISGKIIPAIATTTGLISGLTMCDVVTYVRGAKDIESYRSWFINLAINMYSFSEPMPASKLPNSEFTVWDQVKFDYTGKGQPTLQEFVDVMKKERGWDANMISYGQGILYMVPSFDPRQTGRMNMRLTDAIEDLLKTKLVDGLTELQFVVTADDPNDPDNMLDLPTVTVVIDALTH